MRISDWSSDVCSSDLLSNCRPSTPPHPLFRHPFFRLPPCLSWNGMSAVLGSGARSQGEKHAMSRFDEIYAAAMKDPEGFWAAAAGEIDWTRTWDRVLDDSDKPFYRWFAGGELK